jgi:phosphatidylserine decarboxylase
MLRDAYPFLLVLSICAVISALAGYYFSPGFYYLIFVILLLAAFIAFFFRDPNREAPTDPDLILAPADGHVSIVRLIEKDHPEMGTLVSIFLSVFDVHVNRTPIPGRITKITYQEGKFLNALNHRSSIENEQNVVTVENERITPIAPTWNPKRYLYNS